MKGVGRVGQWRGYTVQLRVVRLRRAAQLRAVRLRRAAQREICTTLLGVAARFPKVLKQPSGFCRSWTNGFLSENPSAENQAYDFTLHQGRSQRRGQSSFACKRFGAEP
ncbi:hypothetical protein U1Q18_001847, partial [Sarracenia purpurea var. burkii]